MKGIENKTARSWERRVVVFWTMESFFLLIFPGDRGTGADSVRVERYRRRAVNLHHAFRLPQHHVTQAHFGPAHSDIQGVTEGLDEAVNCRAFPCGSDVGDGFSGFGIGLPQVAPGRMNEQAYLFPQHDERKYRADEQHDCHRRVGVDGREWGVLGFDDERPHGGGGNTHASEYGRECRPYALFIKQEPEEADDGSGQD